MKSFAFIYNPAAAGGQSEKKIRELQHKISQFENFELYRSKTIGDITDFITRRFDDFDVFVACGGDGTIREIAEKLMYTDKQVGIIPMGTGNDLCKTLNIPRSLSDSFELLINGDSKKIDIGKCNDFIFLNSLGFGFDGLTNRYATGLKHLHPFFSYTISALKAAWKHKPFTAYIQNDDLNIDEEIIMIAMANGRVEGGSFWIAPQASINDGKLNCVVVRKIAKGLIPILLPLFLIKKQGWIPHVRSFEVSELSLRFSRKVSIHADGEVIKNNSYSYAISINNKALDVICKL